jgi:hypothetical protein
MTIMIDTWTIIAIGGRTGRGTHRGATNGVRRGGCVGIEIALVNDLQIAEAVAGRTIGGIYLKEEVIAFENKNSDSSAPRDPHRHEPSLIGCATEYLKKGSYMP